jgi:hypothetical protein
MLAERIRAITALRAGAGQHLVSGALRFWADPLGKAQLRFFQLIEVVAANHVHPIVILDVRAARVYRRRDDREVRLAMLALRSRGLHLFSTIRA